MTPLRRQLIIAYLAAMAVVAHLLESALPGLGPWFKPGFANVFTLIAFLHLGWHAAVEVSMIRVFAGSLALGSFLSPTFFLSFSGAVGAVGVLGLIRLLPAISLGPVGLSLLASLAHMGAQVTAAWFLMIRHHGIFLALPWFLLGSWITGLFNGLLAFLALERLSAINYTESEMESESESDLEETKT